MSIPKAQTADATARPRQEIPQWALDQISEILSRALGEEFVLTSYNVGIDDIGKYDIMPKRSVYGFVESFQEPSPWIDLHFRHPARIHFETTEGMA